VRSACETARAERLGWLTQVRHAFYVGSPHLGAPAEKLGNVVAWVLRAIGVAHTELVADVIDLRSAGIKDLRYASVVAADWEGYDPDALLENRCTVVPLAPGVSHHFGAGALGKRDADVLSSLLGDAMVRVASASYAAAHLPHTGSERRDVKVFPGVHHVALAHDRRVYDWIRSCCESGDGEATT
jgi:hypothetical protein